MRQRRSYLSGFTLLETLVVLVIVALASGLLIQGLGQALGLRVRIASHLGEHRQTALRQHWFMNSVRGLVASHPLDRQTFSGDRGGFQGLSLMALATPQGQPGLLSWQLELDPGSNRLVLNYRQAPADWAIASWDNIAQARFEYQAPDGGWHPQWPPHSPIASAAQRLAFDYLEPAQLPYAVRLAVREAHAGLGDALKPLWLARPHGRARPRVELRDFN